MRARLELKTPRVRQREDESPGIRLEQLAGRAQERVDRRHVHHGHAADDGIEAAVSQREEGGLVGRVAEAIVDGQAGTTLVQR